MKKTYILLAAAAILASSCDGFLEIPSATKFDNDTVFQTEARAEMAVLGAYNGSWSDEIWYQLGMGTDEVYSTEGVTNSKYQLGNYVLSASRTGGSFSTFYKGIESALTESWLWVVRQTTPANFLERAMPSGPRHISIFFAIGEMFLTRQLQ